MSTEQTSTPHLGARVIPFHRPAPKQASTARVTQERLQQGMDLLIQEWASVRAARQFALELEADLDAGAEIDDGDLTFDRDVKMVRGTPGPRRGHPRC